MSRFEQFYQYSENLLRAQYKVSEIIHHARVKGDVREDFLADVVARSFAEPLQFKKGVVYCDTEEYDSEIDLMLCHSNARANRFSESRIGIYPESCRLILEVKSEATGTHIKKFNTKAQQIKTRCAGLNKPAPVCGLFAYGLKLERQTLLERFGYQYDKDTKTYYDDSVSPLEYAFLDFFICIQQDEEDTQPEDSRLIFLRKNNAGDGRYIIANDPTLLEAFIKMIESHL